MLWGCGERMYFLNINNFLNPCKCLLPVCEALDLADFPFEDASSLLAEPSSSILCILGSY